MTTLNSKYNPHRIYEEIDLSDLKVEDEFLSTLNKNKMNGIFTLDLAGFKRAIVQGVLVGVIAGIVFVLKAGSIFGLDLASLVDVIVLAGLATLPPILTSLLTSNEGNFVGSVKIEE